MDTNLQARVQEVTSKNDKIAIAIGKNPNLDDMAAALSLYLGLQQLGKKATIASPTQPLVEHSSLVGIDRVKSQFDGEGGDLVVSFPYREGEIEKVSYTIENNYLNIVVKAGEQGLQFKEQDVHYSRSGGTPQVLFIVGTARLADLGTLFNPEALKDTTIINIDNKADNQGFGDIVLVSQTASSVSEITASQLIGLGVDIDVDIAQNLLSGIIAGTNNFQSPKTTFTAFEMVASFMKKGARREVIEQPFVQSEDQVSSFMPEQMLSGQPTANARPQMPRNPLRNPYLNNTQMPPMSRPQPQAPRTNQPLVQQQPQQQRQPLTQQQIQQQLQQLQRMQSQGQQNPSQQQGNQQNNQPQDNQQRSQGSQATQGQGQKPPSDWLTPKVYKGSSNVS